jgi:hypothetical protein
MLRHAVLNNWKAGVTSEQIQAVIDALGRPPAAIPQISAYSFGPDAGLSDGAADFAVVADFASVDDLRAYLAHPAHVPVAEEVIAPLRESRTVVQFNWGGDA